MLEVKIIPVLSDNYSYFVKDLNSNKTALIDPGEAEPILRFLHNNNENLDYIFNTHHHWDHVGGNLQLKSHYTSAKIIAGLKDHNRVPGVDITLQEGDFFKLGDSQVEVIDVPGHTLGHVCYVFNSSHVFTGDTLFSCGCGRLFEGDYIMMWNSLKKIMTCDDDSMIYSGHEYTENNMKFSLYIDPDNKDLQDAFQRCMILRQNNLSTMPSILSLEKKINPFLRCEDSFIQKKVNIYDPYKVFQYLRAEKDIY